MTPLGGEGRKSTDAQRIVGFDCVFESSPRLRRGKGEDDRGGWVSLPEILRYFRLCLLSSVLYQMWSHIAI